MLEFTLVNHPIDCPICDRAGGCLLQKHYFDWDAKYARNDGIKVKKKKVVDVGPHIVLTRSAASSARAVSACATRSRRPTSWRWPSVATARC